MEKKCLNCKELKEHHAKGLCYSCYKKLNWKPKMIICKRCQRELPLHAKGLCGGCFNFVFRLAKNKAFNYRKYHNIEPDLYKKITKNCVVCGFDKVIDLHHLNENKSDNSEQNMIGLCPNHHRMIHNYTFQAEIFEALKRKGFLVPENKKIGFMHKAS